MNRKRSQWFSFGYLLVVAIPVMVPILLVLRLLRTSTDLTDVKQR